MTMRNKYIIPSLQVSCNSKLELNQTDYCRARQTNTDISLQIDVQIEISDPRFFPAVIHRKRAFLSSTTPRHATPREDKPRHATPPQRPNPTIPEKPKRQSHPVPPRIAPIHLQHATQPKAASAGQETTSTRKQRSRQIQTHTPTQLVLTGQRAGRDAYVYVSDSLAHLKNQLCLSKRLFIVDILTS